MIKNPLSSVDTSVLQYFQGVRTPVRTTFFKTATWIGNVQFVGALCVSIFFLLMYFKKQKEAIAFTCSIIFSGAVAYVAKMVFHRPRPLHALIVETDYSFPSGHATIAVAFYGFIALLLFLHFKNRYTRIVICSVALFLILLIGISRLYLGVHYFSDIVGGYMVGTIGMVVGYAVLKYYPCKKEHKITIPH